MKNLDLSAYGVREMDITEMEQIDGGWWQVVKWVVGGIIAIVEALDVAERFMEGWNSVDCECDCNK